MFFVPFHADNLYCILYRMPVKAFINLKNLVYNAKAIRKTLPDDVKFCAVVKADAYGHGAEKISSALYPYVDCYAVATANEGISLRLAGIDKEILVLTKTLKPDIERAILYGLTLTVSDMSDLKLYNRTAKKLKSTVKVHIKFDTGMGRQGVSTIDALKEELRYLKTHNAIKLEGLYSHFASPENDRSRKKAIDKFLLAKKTVKGYNEKVICHISASGGYIKGEFFDMVRIGLLLYGYKPFKTDRINVRKVMKVYAPVIKEKPLKKGEAALYGEKRAKRNVNLALIRYGYADGLFRRETDGQFSNRCMDVTAICGENSAAAKVFCGEKYVPVMDDAEKLAELYDTIPYEILVKCTLRAEKIYN